jgi:type II secretory ATPase GspE/PulE/Tfp pilus assembly ATPase PilB-like protein
MGKPENINTPAASMSSASSESLAIAKSWGWKTPVPEVLEMAEQALASSKTLAGQLLVEEGLLTTERLDRLLNSKPKDRLTLDWIADQDPALRPFVEKWVTIKAGFAYYPTLNLLTLHSGMLERPELLKRAEESDAILMRIEDHTNVMVFAHFSALVRYQSADRKEELTDPLRQLAGRNCRMAVARSDAVWSFLERARQNDQDTSSTAVSVWYGDGATNEVEKLAAKLINFGLLNHYNDIHFVPNRDGSLKIQMRRNDGDLVTTPVAPRPIAEELAEPLTTFLLQKSGANPQNIVVRDPKDGQLTYRSSAGDTFMRLSFIPLNHPGEHRNLISMRIRFLPRETERISLTDKLNVHPQVVSQIRLAVERDQGMILIVGPTGSGKSSTMAGALSEHYEIYGDRRSRLMFEEPIERFLDGIATQVQIIEREGQDTSMKYMRAMKRHDPDVVVVGEARDEKTVEMSVTSASSGHLVMVSNHAQDTLGGFDVMLQMTPSNMHQLLVDSLSLILSQRLLPELCKCRRIEKPTEQDIEKFRHHLAMIGEEAELPAIIAKRNHQGCPNCEEGHSRKILPINEVLPVTRKVKEAMFRSLQDPTQRPIIRAERTRTLLVSALELLRTHKVSLESILI